GVAADVDGRRALLRGDLALGELDELRRVGADVAHRRARAARAAGAAPVHHRLAAVQAQGAQQGTDADKAAVPDGTKARGPHGRLIPRQPVSRRPSARSEGPESAAPAAAVAAWPGD